MKVKTKAKAGMKVMHGGTVYTVAGRSFRGGHSWYTLTNKTFRGCSVNPNRMRPVVRADKLSVIG